MKKGVIEFSMMTIIIIIIGVVFLALLLSYVNHDNRSWNEQRYCNENPSNCECRYEKDVISIHKNGTYRYKTGDLEIPLVEYYRKEGYVCDLEYSTYECKKCIKYQKKNHCQLDLEKEGILGEDCLCLGYKNLDCPSDGELVNGTMYMGCEYFTVTINIGGITSVESITSSNRCIKARERNPCEKGNPEYILSCDYGVEGFELVDGKCEKCSNSCSEDGYTCGGICAVKEPICRKKELNDLTCEELDTLMIQETFSDGKVCLIRKESLGGFGEIRKLCFDKSDVWKKAFECLKKELQINMDDYCENGALNE